MGPSMQQLLVVLVIVLVLFGAKKIPELAKGLGKGIKNFKEEMKDNELEAENKEKLDEPKNETINAEISEEKKA